MSDHLARDLAASAPIALDGLADALAHWEALPLDDLRAQSDRVTAQFRAWVNDPANRARAISEAPVYLDRMAIEVLLERRYFRE